MHRDELYAQHIDPLVREHRELAAFLESVDLSDPQDQDRVRVAVDELYVHIAKEEDGLFPASVPALDRAEWCQACGNAHPGQRMIDHGV